MIGKEEEKRFGGMKKMNRRIDNEGMRSLKRKKRSSFNRRAGAPRGLGARGSRQKKTPDQPRGRSGGIGNGLFRVFYDLGYLYAFDSGLSVFHGVSLQHELHLGAFF